MLNICLCTVLPNPLTFLLPVQSSCSICTQRLVQCLWRHRADDARVSASGDTHPCKVTPVILHGVVSPDSGERTPCKVTPVILHGTASAGHPIRGRVVSPDSALRQAFLLSSASRSSTARALSLALPLSLPRALPLAPSHSFVGEQVVSFLLSSMRVG